MASTKPNILAAGVSLAIRQGFRNFTRREVAAKAGAAVGSINYHFGGMEELQEAIMYHAVRHGIEAIVAQGLAAKHPVARKAPEALRKAAAKLISS